MGRFVIVDEGKEYDCSLHQDQIVKYQTINNVRIPLQSVSLWGKYYSLMHRDSKVAMIDGV